MRCGARKKFSVEIALLCITKKKKREESKEIKWRHNK